MDSEFWGNADRQRRMKRAHQDVQKTGTTKIGFAEFERKMIERDKAREKKAYEQRKIRMR